MPSDDYRTPTYLYFQRVIIDERIAEGYQVSNAHGLGLGEHFLDKRKQSLLRNQPVPAPKPLDEAFAALAIDSTSPYGVSVRFDVPQRLGHYEVIQLRRGGSARIYRRQLSSKEFEALEALMGTTPRLSDGTSAAAR